MNHRLILISSVLLYFIHVTISALLAYILGSEAVSSLLFSGIAVAIEFVCSVVFFVIITGKFELNKLSQASLVVWLILVIDVITNLLMRVYFQWPFQIVPSLISAGYLSLALIAGSNISSKLFK